ncbi:MAG: hypothetical protein KGN74_03330 [Gemmatimonadota bacterium]|nr:hypothetical protein [Gemmatimonadota bacterium]
MRNAIRPDLGRLTALLVGAVVASSCTSEKLVYRSEPSFTAPPAAAGNFVGYADTVTKQTVCGNCHVEKQAGWAGTLHATAWADLQASGHAGASCEPCHTVNKNGNSATSDSVGWVATHDARYKDVQCESCHGPGLAHVTAPSLSNKPLASIAVDTGTTIGNGCGECHNGTHHPFVEEWKQSLHANPEAHAVGNVSCQPCHTAQGALSTWGITTDYVERDQVATNPQAIVCAVCHDPHAKNNDHQLRFPIDVPDESQNLCMKCHHKRGTPDLTAASRGAHSPEGPTLLGYAGWIPPNMSTSGTDTIIATHGSERNPSLCATCHVSRFAVTDPATGSFVFQATGHLFRAIPCLDAKGMPTTGDCDVSQRTFAACTGSGCHGSGDVARSAMLAVEQRFALLDSTLTHMIAKIPANQFSDTDGKYTTGEGVKFNLSLSRAAGAYVHNPFLIEALMTASIKQITIDYGIPMSDKVNLNNLLPTLMH